MSNEQSLVLSALTSKIKIAPEFRYNLLWPYGAYLLDVPKRLGTNDALDAAVRALVSTHSDYCAPGRRVTTRSLEEYSKALKVLRLFEGIFNENIDLTPDEWKTLVENEFDSSDPSGHMLCCLAKVPNFRRRAKLVLRSKVEDSDLVSEIRDQYQMVKDILKTLHERLESSLKTPNQPFYAHFSHLRTFALGLYIAIVFNRLLSAFDIDNAALNQESTRYAQDIVVIAKESHIYRPLGAAYLELCLGAACAGTNDPETFASAKAALLDYRGEFPGRLQPTPELTAEYTSQCLRLID
ncbi:MAG: hypothetical protein Q9227_009102 [Pyrenula ochraceoflavens]